MPRTLIHDPLCRVCKNVEDGIHVISSCKLYKENNFTRNYFVGKPNATELDHEYTYIYIYVVETTDLCIPMWFGKYVWSVIFMVYISIPDIEIVIFCKITMLC